MTHPAAQHIVITSINPPTSAVRAYADLAGFRLHVVADIKTPQDWDVPGVDFLSVERQQRLPYRIVERLPSNHYSRKMLGYLESMAQGALMIVDTDDDNTPMGSYGFPPWDGVQTVTDAELDFINPYTLFGAVGVWPRGMPLDSLRTDHTPLSLTPARPTVGVWQGLVNGDPDVDAIYRLTNNSSCVFTQKDPVVLGHGTLAPFNSQNTAFRRELFALLYLPTTVTFRFTDILRSLVAQPIMWRFGYRLGFCSPTVVQDRNTHDYFQDFVSEIPMYLHARRASQVARQCAEASDSITNALLATYRTLAQVGIVEYSEIDVVQAWTDDVVKLTSVDGL